MTRTKSSFGLGVQIRPQLLGTPPGGCWDPCSAGLCPHGAAKPDPICHPSLQRQAAAARLELSAKLMVSVEDTEDCLVHPILGFDFQTSSFLISKDMCLYYSKRNRNTFLGKQQLALLEAGHRERQPPRWAVGGFRVRHRLEKVGHSSGQGIAWS